MTIDIAMQGTRVIGGIAPRLRGAAGGTPPAPPQGVIQSFAIENTNSGGTSPGFVKIGLPFKKGDMPANCVPKVSIQGGAEITDIQFDERVSWMDGSLKFCVCRFKDATFSASQSRTYDVEAVSGTYDNTERISLATIKANSDVQVVVDTLKDHTPDTTVGSGTFEAKFNDTVATRLTKVGGGKVCESWMGWIMFKDQTGGAEDAHLKAIFHIDAWNNGSNGITDYSYVAVLTQDWWSVAGKDRRNYNAVLKDGAATIETFSAIPHYYHSQWATVRPDNDAQHAQRYWSVNIPTLVYKPDSAYWIETGLVPPQELGFTPTNNLTNTLSIMENMDHRYNIDDGGGYMGRGVISNSDAIAIVNPSADNNRVARVHAHVGLHIPYHYRVDTNRNRSSKASDAWNDFTGEGADKANTVMSFEMGPKLLAEYDFQSDGMPPPATGHRNGAGAALGGWVEPLGGDGPWNVSSGASHGVNYCYFTYLLEGERYILEAQMDLCTNLTHQNNGNLGNGQPYPHFQSSRPSLSIPTTQYLGTGDLNSGNNSRGVGLGLAIMAGAVAVVPDNDVARNFFTVYNDQHGDYLAVSLSYYPQSQKDAGVSVFNEGHGVEAPWAQALIVMGSFFNYRLTENANIKTYADHMAKFSANMWNGTQSAKSMAYRFIPTPKSQPWESVTNEFHHPKYASHIVDAGTSASSTLIGLSSLTPDSVEFPVTVGDSAFFMDNNNLGNQSRDIPAEITEGTEYYVVSISGLNIEVSATPGGPAISFASVNNAAISFLLQSQDAVAMTAPNISSADSYTMMQKAAAVLAHHTGSPNINASHVTEAQNFTSNITVDIDSKLNWRYAL